MKFNYLYLFDIKFYNKASNDFNIKYLQVISIFIILNNKNNFKLIFSRH